MYLDQLPEAEKPAFVELPRLKRNFILLKSQISSDVIFSCRSFSDVDYLTIAVYSMSTAFCLFSIFIKTNFIP